LIYSVLSPDFWLFPSNFDLCCKMKQKDIEIKTETRWIIIFCLVFAGEMVFSLPFHVARFFRPTVLSVFNLSNAELGDVMAIYGIMAMVTYFPGGAIADRFSTRKLMTISLVGTALGGIYFAGIPGILGLSVLFGYWGVTTIFLFWAALIKTTREWGGKLAQGRAFGILDGGRGLVAAGAATFAVMLLSRFLPDNSGVNQRAEALQAVIYFYIILTFIAALLVWIFIPESKLEKVSTNANTIADIKKVFNNRLIWLQAVVVVSSYSAYKGLDYYSLYVVDVLGKDEVTAAWFVSNAAYIRAVAAVLAGLLVDRFSATKVLSFVFALLLINYVMLTLFSPVSIAINIIYGNLIFTFAGVYALRGVYFALLEETNIEKALTGTAVGFISVIGYTPDVFFNSVAGRILDASPGLGGFQNFYKFLAVLAVIGLISSLAIVNGKTKSVN